MKNIALILSFAAFLISGCATTSWQETKAALSPDELAALEAANGFRQARTFEEFDRVTTDDLVVISSYVKSNKFGYNQTHSNKKDYWDEWVKKVKSDLFIRTVTRRDLRVNILGDNAEVFYIQDNLRRGGGERDWKGSVTYIFKLRREGGVWKVYYHEVFPN